MAHGKSSEADPGSLKGDQFAALCMAMKDGVVVHDKAGKIIHFNPAALAILGLSENELLGKTPLDPQWKTLAEDLSPLHGENHPASKALSTGLSQIDQVMGVQRVTGELRWLEVTAIPLRNQDETTQILVTFRDITDARAATEELKATQERLKEREKFLASTLSSLPCLVSYLDQDYIYRYANQTYHHWFGISPEQIIGKRLAETIGVAALELAKPFLDQALSGREQRFEREMPYRAGEKRHVQVTYIPDRTPGGLIAGVYAIVQDISAQVQVSRFAEERERHLQKVIDGVPAMIGYWDKNLRNVYANKEYSSYFGKSPSLLKGKHIKEVIGPALYEKNQAFLEAALQGRRQTFERLISTPDGRERETLATYVPDFSGDEVLGIFVVVVDITQIKTLERERQQMEAKLVASSKMSSLGQMAGGIAHEINNPLAIISGLTSSLLSACESGEYERSEFTTKLGRIEATVQRAARIIRGLRSFSGGTGKQSSSPSQIGKIVSDTLDLCRENFRHHHVTVKIAGTSATAALVECDPTQISQILLNLLNNSFYAIQSLSDKWIEIEMRVDGPSLKLRVIDSGTGIPIDVRIRMMEPFFTTKPIGQGTGLGLSISKGLAESNNGSLRYVESSPHTCFELTLPLVDTKRGAM